VDFDDRPAVFYPILGFVLGMAVILPLMLTFDHARPWIALAGLGCAALMYFGPKWLRRRQYGGD